MEKEREKVTATAHFLQPHNLEGAYRPLWESCHEFGVLHIKDSFLSSRVTSDNNNHHTLCRITEGDDGNNNNNNTGYIYTLATKAFSAAMIPLQRQGTAAEVKKEHRLLSVNVNTFTDTTATRCGCSCLPCDYSNTTLSLCHYHVIIILSLTLANLPC
jgi:hypothetical protein